MPLRDYETLISRLFETFLVFETKKQVVPWHQWHHLVWRHWVYSKVHSCLVASVTTSNKHWFNFHSMGNVSNFIVWKPSSFSSLIIFGWGLRVLPLVWKTIYSHTLENDVYYFAGTSITLIKKVLFLISSTIMSWIS